MIESHTLPSLPVSIVAVLAADALDAAKGSNRGTKVDAHCGLKLLVALCVADELLPHHSRASFPNMMRS